MERTSVEDFQDYHNQQAVADEDVVLHSSPQPLEKAECMELGLEDDDASLSGSAHHSPDEAVFDRPSRTSSPRTSHGSDDDISILESSCDPRSHPSPFTPLLPRSRFRNPSSVRAMQMDTTPPHLATPSSQQRHRLPTPSRNGTPRSARSHRSAMNSPSKLSPTKKLKKEYPLVLLHVTLLPLPHSYSPEILETVLPPSILANWKLLQEKATDTVLERGILIPHPKEDYDLLEERLLESLELKIPRILKCGHYHLSPEEEADIAAESDSEAETDANDPDICLDCGRRIRDGKFGSAGTGSKRWDIKLFAANGLMRAAAWSAAWREMERVDVEILPWMEEVMKRELELRREEDERARAEQAHAEREEGIGGLDDARLREIYGHDAQAFVDGLGDEMSAAASTQRTPAQMPVKSKDDVPLWDLVQDYIYHAAQDRRNLAIFLLSIVVLFLSMGPFTSSRRDSEVQDMRHSVRTPVAQASAFGTNTLSKASVPVVSTASAVPSPSPSPEPQEPDEQDQSVPWTETAEDVAREMLED
ncbi:hypothetical protein IMSHALPRED_006894 [Imshaugia aleurites]|uniref:Uncharacterized protein n=1 Tax=Imshaugia aleurites TaxID=172621 RepID=A0A8H3FQU2_9LECA|nr:hypothetical protein IMSHALPRED_006894 [Imshaugia aleurites]